MLEDLQFCNECPERKYARVPVPGFGNVQSKIVLLGRNPGKEEDRRGVPFVGRAGRRLDKGLVPTLLLRREIWVTNTSKCMTPSNVAPSKHCRSVCVAKWLLAELREINPELVISLGNEALQVFEPFGRVGQLHGTYFKTQKIWQPDEKVWLFVSYHPSAALRGIVVDEHFKCDMTLLAAFRKEIGI